MSVEQFGYKQELHRALTFRDLLVYGVDCQLLSH